MRPRDGKHEARQARARADVEKAGSLFTLAGIGPVRIDRVQQRQAVHDMPLVRYVSVCDGREIVLGVLGEQEVEECVELVPLLSRQIDAERDRRRAGADVPPA